jgi:lysophospholipase L1-like esterase
MVRRIVTGSLIAAFLFLSSGAMAQPIPVSDSFSGNNSFVRLVFNRILNSHGLDSFYQKLYRLKSSNRGAVSIVHIGDSHIQADLLTAEVRDGLQQFFGNAGRGLVFPYQLAQSNAPGDISSFSNTSWQFNRVAHPEIAFPYGISGYGIQSNNANASITLSLRDQETFNRLKFFTGNTSWTLTTVNNDSTYALNNRDSLGYHEVLLENAASSFSLNAVPSGDTKEFYGVSLENSMPGVIYHTIGVNGARYDQYNVADRFWEQLPALKADLYIVSLGTNEAQRTTFPESAFLAGLNTFIQHLKRSSPGASILITTAPDSYKGRRSNLVLKQLNTALTNYCNKNFIPLWDLYNITNGYGSAYNWSRRGLMSRDRVHFTSAGYRLQGNLLFTALAKGYNSYFNAIK